MHSTHGQLQGQCKEGEDGQKKVDGGPGLHESQLYPDGYAHKVVRTYSRYRQKWCNLGDVLQAESSDSDYSDGEKEDAWPDSHILECLRLFKNSDAPTLL